MLQRAMITALLCLTPQLSTAAGLINDMQACQALIQFVNIKLDSAPATYNNAAITNVRIGLNSYNNYIQTEIVTPGLLQFNGGDATKAEAMQVQVNTYKTTLVKQYEARYPQNRLFTDHAVALNNCAKKAVPAGEALAELKTALNAMVELAKQG